MKLYKKHNKSGIIPYEKSRDRGEIIRNDYCFNTELNGLMLTHTLNKLKELELKQSIRNRQGGVSKKVRVCFLIDTASRLSANSVYTNMTKNNFFDPFMVLYQSYGDDFQKNSALYTEHIRDLKILRDAGYKVFDGYDKSGHFIPLENFTPDIVFVTAPYLDYQDTYLSNIYLNINFLTCYLTYGINSSNSYSYHYNNRRINSCWKYFVETRTDYEELLRHSIHCGTNTVLTGYPKLDSYAKPLKKCKIPAKIDNGKPIVIYAPHHSIRNTWEASNIATFHLYYKYFLNLAKENSNINFVFKPHPNLIFAVSEKKIMTTAEYERYIFDWNNLPNGIVIQTGDYIDLFRRSDLMIMDCGSFIGEWLPTGKPCMYLINPERDKTTYMDGFSLLCQKILSKYYLCHNTDEISRFFDLIINQHQDPLKEDRQKLIESVFINIGTAGEYIMKYLENILK